MRCVLTLSVQAHVFDSCKCLCVYVGEIGMLGSSICARALLPIEQETETHRVRKKFQEFRF